MICLRCSFSNTEAAATCLQCGAMLAGFQEACEKSEGELSAPEHAGQPVRYAGFWIRFCAVTLDSLVLALVSLLVYGLAIGIVSALAPGIKEPAKALLIPQLAADALIKAFYYIYFHAVTGQTVGKKAFGLKVVRQDGCEIGWPRSAVRYGATFLSMLIFGLGYLWVALDERKQGWHDKLAASFVVRL